MSRKIKLKKNKRKPGLKFKDKPETKGLPDPKIIKTLQLATSHYKAGDLFQAEQLYRQVLQADPHNADVLNSLGNVLRLSGKAEEAAGCYQKAVSSKPGVAELHANLGLALKDLGKLEEAISCFRKALKLKPELAELHIGLGNILQESGKLEEAIQSYKMALAIKPDNITAHKNLGVALKESGRMEKAAASFRNALTVKPEYGEAYRNLADLIKYSEGDDDLRNMEKLYAQRNLYREDRMHLGFALGKIFENLRNYDKAFGFLDEANRLKRQSYHYSVEADKEYFARIKNTFSKDFFSSHPGQGNPDETPLFIIGMPRSGTTLIEQILSSHSLVFGAGELMDLTDVTKSFCSAPNLDFPEGALRLETTDFENMGTAYLLKIRKYSQTAKYITDKMPHNFLRVGLIKKILPNAKVIHCVRDPLDNCLSIFKNYFSVKNSHQYAYDLQELGQYYNLYRSLMAHWEKNLPGFMYTIRYEDMITDQKKQTEKLLSFCNLHWEEACLEFHQSERRVQTASFVQVRQAIYTDSMQLWKNYEKHLEPLRRTLEKDSAN